MRLRRLLIPLLFVLLAACQPAVQVLPASPTASLPAPAGASPTAIPTASPSLLPETPAATRAVSPTLAITETAVATALPTPLPEIARFAVIGDYGSGDLPEQAVAELVKSWQPDFIITTGDNNYPNGSASTIDAHIGQFYHEYIYPYHGEYGDGADINRFFPTLGNHDWISADAQPYLEYFTLPGNERYYDFTWGPAHLFALDSDSREPDGVGQSSLQAEWLRQGLENSTHPWQVVYFHHPPYASGPHGPIDWMQWPFQQWGADIVIAGHDHVYERIERDGFTYVINGLGGGAVYSFNSPIEGSVVRYNAEYGAMLVEAYPEKITFQFINTAGEVIDSFSLADPE